MRLDSLEAALVTQQFSEHIAQHAPCVLDASLTLQNVMGIEPGTKPMGSGLVAKKWNFPQKSYEWGEAHENNYTSEPEMKRPRIDIPDIVIDGPEKVRTCGPRDVMPQCQDSNSSRYMTASDSKRACDSPSATKWYSTESRSRPVAAVQEEEPPDTIILTNPRKRRAPETLPRKPLWWTAPQEQLPFHPIPQAKIAQDFTTRSQVLGPPIQAGKNEPLFIRDQPSLRSHMPTSAMGPFPPLHRLACDASPPLIPCTDDIQLGAQETAPLYWDSSLAGKICDWLEGPNTSSAKWYLTSIEFRGLSQPFQMRQPDEVKLIRMTLPATEQKSERDWFVIEARYGISTAPATADGSRKFWVMAFPVHIVSVSLSNSTSPRAKVKTTLTLGHEHRVPAMHGSGVQMSLLEGFMRACSMGKGVIDMRSDEALF